MTLTTKLITSTAASIVLAFGLAAGPASAQEAYRAAIDALGVDVETVGTGDFTTANVSTEDPFGDLEVDLTLDTDDTIGTWLATLDNLQLTELVQRCNLITANATTYAVEATAFCDSTRDIVQGDTDAATPPAAEGAPMTPAPLPTPTPIPAP